MGFDNECTSYEEMRNRNVERNNNVMRMLGLLSPRIENEHQLKPSRGQRSGKNLQRRDTEPRRSERLATVAKTLPVCEDVCGIVSPVSGKIWSCKRRERSKQVLKKKILGKTKQMEHDDSLEDSYSSDSSTQSLYAMKENMDFDNSRNVHENPLQTQTAADIFGSSSTPVAFDFANTQIGTAFGTQFQELFIRALMQSMASLVGPLSGLMSLPQGDCSGKMASLVGPPLGVIALPQGGSSENIAVSVEGEHAGKIWNEATYNISEARRKRKTIMTRTSAGEGSDSQADFVAPENESPQERSVRIRRLSRFRGRRAKDLTSNRKALKKLPYVLHVDGMAKARGIHRHLWRAAVRGQCGRLDPMMDNINHHPKQVVDSIWHGIQKEWEFQGFDHRAREMFERSATKFMRNRKMQLKTKCKKNVDGPKPADVRGTHWTKIVDLTKKLSTESTVGESTQNNGKGKNPISAHKKGKQDSVFVEQDIKQVSGRWSPNSLHRTNDTFGLESDNMDARIRSLQSELLTLQKSRKVGSCVQDSAVWGELNTMDDSILGQPPDGVFDSMKENVAPTNGESNQEEAETSRKNTTEGDEDVQTKMLCKAQEKKSSLLLLKERKVHGKEVGDKLQETEMDCGDVVRVFAFTGGRKEEIGKAIVMGLAGSKYARKVIPEGWRSIKVTSLTSTGSSKLCPFPAGWTEQSKSQTVKEASGRSILWPDMLLLSLVHV